jgi:hypothetical protein
MHAAVFLPQQSGHYPCAFSKLLLQLHLESWLPLLLVLLAILPPFLLRVLCRYTLAAGVGAYAGVFLYRNSRLAGSPNLDNWVTAGVEAVEGAWGNHVVSPLVTVRDELFKTFRE